jgi:hypothetical protein
MNGYAPERDIHLDLSDTILAFQLAGGGKR